MPADSTPQVLGASGQVGHYLLRRLGGDAIACARRTPAWSSHDAARWLPFDLWTHAQPPVSARLISAGPLDGCVGWLERAGPGPLRRIVALGSMSAVHKLQSPDRGERSLAQHLLDHEARLLAFAARHGIVCTILRPTLIWGAGLDHSLTPYALRARRRGYAWIPTGASGLRQPVHADDLAALCIAVLADSGHDGACLDVGGGERLPLGVMLGRVVASVGAHVLPLPCPRRMLSAAGRLGVRLGLARAAAAARAVADQCAGSDDAWRSCALQPRGFDPRAADWLAPG